MLKQCLATLVSGRATGSLTCEIIVVDNASHDGSADIATSFEGVRVIRSLRNLGYARANNAGLKVAQAYHLLVLNPDTVPYEGSIERLVEFQRTHPRAGIVSPRLLNADRSPQPSAFRFPTLMMVALDLINLPSVVPGRIRQWIYGSRLNGRYMREASNHAPFRIDHPLGACMLLSREAYQETGGFDPGIFMYSEEIDLAIRFKDAGWECWQVPASEVVHLGGQSTRQVPDRMYVELWRSRLYVYRKHYPVLAQIGLSLLLVLFQLATIVSVLLHSAISRKFGTASKRRVFRALKVISLVFGR